MTWSKVIGTVRVSIFLAAFAAKQRRNVALFTSLRALRETKTGHYQVIRIYPDIMYIASHPKTTVRQGEPK
jgi:hypothetical protein